jgi:ethanolamine ammonia-lyase small subunit
VSESVVRATDRWAALGQLTPARLALGRAGVSLPTDAVLRFGWDHAQARDAVQQPFDSEMLRSEIERRGFHTLQVASRAPDRATYLMRPDLGRRLADASAAALDAVPRTECELLLVVGDGLSCSAVSRHAPPLLEQIAKQLPAHWRLGPVVIASQARVALADDIGARLGAPMVAILIGERPGLSSPDSLGIYLTWAPHVGRSDAERNCISNIRPQGLGYEPAARRLLWLCGRARQLSLSGVALKDQSEQQGSIELPDQSERRDRR